MTDESPDPPLTADAGVLPFPDRLDGKKVTFVYTMFHHLGDFTVMGGLLKKFDLLKVEFESLVVHRSSPYVPYFDGGTENRFYDVGTVHGFFELIARLRRQKFEGRLVFGIPMAPGSLQAFFFFWILKKLAALTYIVDFNLINADILTPPRRRYIFDRHLAQAAQILQHPEWMNDTDMPLALVSPAGAEPRQRRRIGFFPWSGRSRLSEFQWPDSHWLELAKLILEDPGCEIALLGRDDNFARFEQILRSQLPEKMRPRFLSRPASSVPELLGTLRDLDALITVNTSALHIAHALKLPSVTLSGSSAEFWLPEGDHVRIVRDATGALPPSDKNCHDPLQPSLQRVRVPEVYSAFCELTNHRRSE